jgi:bacteriorhodopsin
MYIVAIAWIYVVLMMSITEHSIVAGIMTFLMYGVLPLTIILYLMRTPHRRRQRQAIKQLQNQVTEPTAKKNPEDTAHPT